MAYEAMPYHSGEIVVLGDLHYDSYRRLTLNPIDVWAPASQWTAARKGWAIGTPLV